MSDAADEGVAELELQQLGRERDLYREEAGQLSVQLSSVRQELRQLEQQLVSEQDAAAGQLEQLGQQLAKETGRREELELDMNRKEEELR